MRELDRAGWKRFDERVVSEDDYRETKVGVV